MRDAETTLNTHLAIILDKTRHNWKVKTEQTDIMIKKARLDLLIVEEGYPSVIIECKMGMKPDDITKRFENKFKGGDKPYLIVELKYNKVKSVEKLEKTNSLRFCFHYGTIRFPKNGWLKGSINYLSTLIQYGRETINHDDIEILNDAINEAATLISNSVNRDEISSIMAQEPSPQTDRMAALTIAGAISFHDMAIEKNIKTMSEIMKKGKPNIAELESAWRSILKLNYFPIFDPAFEIITKLPVNTSKEIVEKIYKADRSVKAPNSSRLHGEIFQRVISDRKKLAAFYTVPTAASLLSSITIPNIKDVKNIRIADFACGTGALLLSSYKIMAANYELSRKSMEKLHPIIMSNCLIGADVLPIATHLTAAGLTNMYPKKQYETTRIHQPIQGGKDHKIGSLEWIKQDATLDSSENRLTGKGIAGTLAAPAHNSCDVVIMNPPYYGSQGPGSRSNEDMRQLFTAFDATISDSKKMSARASKLYKNTNCANKRSLATFFVDLAHSKLKKGGHLGLILPMTATTGNKWKKFREFIRKNYTDIIIIGGNFSADTNMKEIIMYGHKSKKPSGRGKFVTLDESPKSFLEGVCVGESIKKTNPVPLENIPEGGTRITLADYEIGTAMECPLDAEWSAPSMINYTLPQIAHHIKNSKLYIPPSFTPIELPTIKLSEISSIGPSHLQIKGANSIPGRSTSYTGPFNVRKYRRGSVYPSLWNNNNTKQNKLIVEPDKSLERRRKKSDDDIQSIWNTASNIHMNIEARTTSQSLMMAYTSNVVVGGVAWPSVITEEKYQKGLAVWCNSTLGILCRWGMSNHQQPGRSRISRTAIKNLPIPSKELLEPLCDTFDEFKGKKFDKMKNLWKDKNRIKMDDSMLESFGIEADLTYIRNHLCAEPTIYEKNLADDLKNLIP